MSSRIQNQIRIIALVAVFLLFAGAVSTALAQTRKDLPQRDASLYAEDPQPLTMMQCAQCHTKHFSDLKNAGGNHQFDCRECHEVFHAYNPLKDNYADIMPQCDTCHGQPHGTTHIQCLNCHDNPHAPTSVKMTHMLSGICSDCHTPQAQELQQFPSKHTEQTCDSCHYNRHGYIPQCAECHDPHFATQAEATCMTCHPVHQPLTIVFKDEIELETCNACHSDIYAKWQGGNSKHAQVSCAECHTAHASIPECSMCHVAPKGHAKQMLEQFPDCLMCHLDVHDLPVKQ